MTDFHHSLDEPLPAPVPVPTPSYTFRFKTFAHPFVAELIEQLNRGPLEDLFDPVFLAGLRRSIFTELYNPYTNDPQSTVVAEEENVDFSPEGAYSSYNWELFFHIPLAIAVHLSESQRFAEAQKWFHLIFDPTANNADAEAPARFWRFLPFRRNDPLPSLERLLTLLATPDAELTPDQRDQRDQIQSSLMASLEYPFEPHRGAMGNPIAYQYHVVMKYLDNLIAWGDSLFLEGTLESLNEATMRYVLARNILGPPPAQLPARSTPPRTFAQLKAAGLDPMSNALVQLEAHIAFNRPMARTPDPAGAQGAAVAGIGRTLYFCIPPNERLLAYWPTVDGRLFKIRHCMDIHGTVRQLPLFDAPLDPGLLVRAAAGGIDMGSVVSGLNRGIGPVRALPLIQTALSLCAEVKELGNALLAAMEKRDAEQLAKLRASHETNLETRTRELAFLRRKQAEEATELLLRGRQSTVDRYRFYLHLLGQSPDADLVPDVLALDRRDLDEDTFDDAFQSLVTQYDKQIPLLTFPTLSPANDTPAVDSGLSGAGDLHLSTTENAELDHSKRARDFRLAASVSEVIAGVLTLIPEFTLALEFMGIGGNSKIFGGSKLSDTIKIAAEIQRTVAGWESDQAGLSSRTAGHERRVEEWTQQANQAARELTHLGRQVVASLLAEQIARHEQDIAQTRQDQAAEIERLLTSGKQTSEDLYAWMQGEVSRLYYDYYRLAVDAARRAETTMKYELMRPELDATTYVRANYFNSGKQGLLAADALHLDLRRMEQAYHDYDQREIELTRHVSIRQLDAQALLALRITGRCEVTIPEWFFDRDCPGHYLRRLKYVSFSLPTVAGPWTSINCTLTLLRSQVRRTPDLDASGAYVRDPSADDRFADYFGPSGAIVTSGGDNDSGRFETNLADSRFLTFEGAGAVSTWRIELPAEFRAFDYTNISDAILHLRYTARAGGDPLATEATKAAAQALAAPTSGALLFVLRTDFPAEWSAFGAGGDLAIPLRREHFPYAVLDRTLVINDLLVFELNGTTLPSPSSAALPATANDDLNGPAGTAVLPLDLDRSAPDVCLVIRYAAT